MTLPTKLSDILTEIESGEVKNHDSSTTTLINKFIGS